MINDSILSSNDCYVDVDLNSQQELFEHFNNIFLQKDYVKSTFLKSLIDRENKYPTAIELNNSISIAIPHTDSEHINQLKIVPCILKNNIKFSVMGNKTKQADVKIVFFLLINDKHNHIDILRDIITLCSDTETINNILNCKTSDQLYELLITHLN